MSENGAKPRKRELWKYLLFAALLALLAMICMGWYITTSSFQAMVRRRLVAELEGITGGRVELGSFHTSPLRLRVEVRNLTIHGREEPSDIPYAHVDRVVAEIKIISVLGAEFGFHSLLLDHPVVHIIVYPDGSTNQPTPKLRQAAVQSPVEQLFRLSISRLEVRRGEILWNQQSIPLDFAVNDVSADMTYSLLRRRYETNLLLGKVVTRFDDYRPVAWMTEAHFALGANVIEIRSLKASSGRSHLEFSGRLDNFRDPQLAGIYSASVNLQEAAAIAHRSELRNGSVQFQGRGSWSRQQFSSTGKIVAEDLDWRDQSLSISQAAVSTTYSVTSEQLTLSQIQARLLGGSVTGQANVSDWLSPEHEARNEKTRSAGQQKGELALKFKDVSLGAMAEALSTARRPLRRLNLAGFGSGTIESRWKGSLHDAEISLTAAVKAPGVTSISQMPVNANLRVAYRMTTGDLDVAELHAATRASELRASGILARTGSLRVSASTSDLSECQKLLIAAGEPGPIPAILHGGASFNGTLTGRLPNLAAAGNLQAQDFDLLVPQRGAQQAVHWDSLNAQVQLSRAGVAAHNGLLDRGDTSVNFDLSAGFDHGRLTARTPFTARLNMDNAELADVMSLAGYPYPLRGKMDLVLNLSGTRTQPQGTGHIQLSGVNAYGESFRSFASDLRLENREVQLSQAQLAYGDAHAEGAASYNFSTHAFGFDIKGGNFDLARFSRSYSGRVAVQGRADFTARGSGTLDRPMINATFQIHDLIVDQERAGDFTLQAVTQGPELHLTGRSQFEPGALSVDGDVHMGGDWPSTLDFHFTRLDVDAVLRAALRGRLTGHSSASGAVRVQGPLLRPRDLSVDGTLSDFRANIENLTLHNQGPVDFAVSAQSLRLSAFRLVGVDTDLSAYGTVQLTDEGKLDLHANGSANLKLIESYDPSFTSSGMLTVDLSLTGTLNRPVAQGKVQISNGAVAYIDLTSALSDINGSLTFSQNRLQIDTLTARTGGGLVTFGGYATWYQRQLIFDLTLQEREVRLRYPAGVSSTANADLRFAGTSSASTLSGDITITKLSVTPGFDFGSYLTRSSQAPILPPTNPILNRIRLDVHIVTTPELQMQTAVVRLSGDADLRLRGTAAKPVLLGRADVLEGQVFFNGTKYELERGEVSFSNPVSTTPVLDLQATTHVRDYDITLSLTGEPDKLKVSYRSEPPLPEADIITLLALGRTTQETAQLQQAGQNSFTQEASSAIINQALNTTFSNRAQRLFGVSRIKIDPEGLNTETTLGRGPLVTIEEQVANNLTITYSTSVEQAAQQIIQVEYNLSRNVSIVAIRDQNGVVSFDVRIRRRKR